LKTKEDPLKQSYVLVFFISGDKVLLGIKNRGILAGFRNGHGGKYERGENFAQAVERECRVEAECGLWPNDKDLKPSSRLIVKHPKTGNSFDVHIVDIARVYDFSGEVVDSDEMRDNRWFEIANLPSEGMHEEKKPWLEKFLTGKDLNIQIEYDQNGEIAKIKIQELNGLS
jgi:8-oxo-dGTP diphosphatase